MGKKLSFLSKGWAMRYLNLIFLMTFISLGLQAAHEYESESSNNVETTLAQSGSKTESWREWAKRKGKETAAAAKRYHDNLAISLNPNRSTESTDESLPKAVALDFNHHENLVQENNDTVVMNLSRLPSDDPREDEILTPDENEVREKVEEIRKLEDQKKSSLLQILKNSLWDDLQDIGDSLNKLFVEQDSYKGDWDYTPEEINSVSSDQTDLKIEGVKLTPESLSKIQAINVLLSIRELNPLDSLLNLFFPMKKFERLISDLATSGTIPSDIGKRLQDVVDDIPLTPNIVKTSLVATGIGLAESKTAAVDYLAQALPSLQSIATGIHDYQKIKETVDGSANPIEVLRQVHELDLKTLKNVPIEKVLKVIDEKTQAKNRAVEKTRKINRIVTQIAVILFALAMGALVLTIISSATKSPVLKAVTQVVIIIDVAALVGGIGYAGLKLGNAIGVKASPKEGLAQGESTESSQPVDDSGFEDSVMV